MRSTGLVVQAPGSMTRFATYILGVFAGGFQACVRSRMKIHGDLFVALGTGF